jgi:hypothetical protein
MKSTDDNVKCNQPSTASPRGRSSTAWRATTAASCILPALISACTAAISGAAVRSTISRLIRRSRHYRPFRHLKEICFSQLGLARTKSAAQFALARAFGRRVTKRSDPRTVRVRHAIM